MTTNEPRYLVAAVKPWNVSAFQRHTSDLQGKWRLLENPDDLTAELVEDFAPEYVFFPHWSWKVATDILARTQCIGFHMTDLPYGRGGSPLQNLITNGHEETMVSALRLTEDLDAGPVHLKRPLSLSGSAQQIFERFSDLSYEMIAHIIQHRPEPTEQAGDAVVFPRRTPEQSTLPDGGTVSHLYDHIRMLDAETYPRAFLEHGDFCLEFSDCEQDGDRLMAKVTITNKDKPNG